MAPEKMQGRLIILSGPSGVGKSTIVRELLRKCPLPLELSVSATTRAPRAGEQNGVDYLFLRPEEFQRRRQNDEFLECFEVFGRGYWYGTLKETVTTGLQQGKSVILEIDVNGAQQVLARYPDAISIFIHPGSLAELERRLRGRESDPEAAIQRRLEVAKLELSQAENYNHVVVNVDVAQTVDDICRILGDS